MKVYAVIDRTYNCDELIYVCASKEIAYKKAEDYTKDYECFVIIEEHDLIDAAELEEDETIANLIYERGKEDDGTRYSFEEVKNKILKD